MREKTKYWAEKVIKGIKCGEIRFFYSPVYFLIATVFTYVCWYFDLAIVGFSALGIGYGITVALSKDLSSTLIFPFVFTLALYKTYSSDHAPYIYVAALFVLVAGVIIHLFRFRPFQGRGRAHFFTFGAAALFFAVAVSGVFAPERSVSLSLAVGGLAALLFFQTVLLGLSIGTSDKERARSLLLYAVVFASFLAAGEFITHLFRLGFNEFFSNKNLPGETAANQYANLMARSLPVFFYLSIGKKKGAHFWLVPAFLMIGVIALTNSRATLLMTAATVLVAFVVCTIKSKERKGFLLTFLVLSALSLTFLLTQKELVKKIFAVVIERGIDDYHRFELWETGWKMFLRHPVFGAGLGDRIGYGIEGPMSASFVPFWYHNTFVQTLASFGLVGAAGLILFLTSMFYTTFSAKDGKAFTAGFILLFILAVSMLDIHFYTPQTLWQMTVLTVPCYRFIPKRDEKSRRGIILPPAE